MQTSLLLWICCSAAAALCSQAVDYNQSIGLQFAYLQKAVMCGKEKFERWDIGDDQQHYPKVDKSRLRFVQAGFLDFTEAAAGVGRMLEPDGCFVQMRGTDGLVSGLLAPQTWQTAFRPQSCPDCKVMHGFYKSYESIRPAIFYALDEFGCKDRPLFLSGHSLGASGMHFLLFDALELGYSIAHAYALESTRPGNTAFAQALQEKTKGLDVWRISHYQDIAVQYPPTEVDSPLGHYKYQHALREIYFDHKAGAHYKECDVEDHTCSGQSQFKVTKDWLAYHCWFADMNPCTCGASSATNSLLV